MRYHIDHLHARGCAEGVPEDEVFPMGTPDTAEVVVNLPAENSPQALPESVPDAPPEPKRGS